MSPTAMPYLPIYAFALLYVAAALAWNLPHGVGLAYLGISVVCFAMYARDKAAARNGDWRTPEGTLLMLGLFGGWPGAVLAQQWLRHKTKKASFRTMFWMTVVVNVIAFLYLGFPGSPLR